MDLVPALAGGLLAHAAGAGRIDGGPAAGMCADFELDLVAEVSPEAPAVAELHRVGQSTADGLSVGGRSVPAYDLGTRMFAQPLLQGFRGAVGQHVDPLASLGVGHDGGVAVTSLEREVIHCDHPWDLPPGQRQALQMAQRGTAGNGHGQQAGQAGRRPTA